MSKRWQRGCALSLGGEVMWFVILALDVFVFARITQWVWEHTVSPWLQVPRLTFVEAFIITLLTSVMSFQIVERINKQLEEN